MKSNSFPHHAALNHITTHNRNPKTEHNYHEMSHETYLHAHQTNFYSSLHVMLYFDKYNNSIPFIKEQFLQVNKRFVDCCIDSIPFHVDLMYILVQKLEVLIRHFIEK